MFFLMKKRGLSCAKPSFDPSAVLCICCDDAIHTVVKVEALPTTELLVVTSVAVIAYDGRMSTKPSFDPSALICVCCDDAIHTFVKVDVLLTTELLVVTSVAARAYDGNISMGTRGE